MGFSYNKNGRLERLHEILGPDAPEENDMLAFTLQLVESRVLSYINHPTIPPELEMALLAIAAAYYRAAKPGTETSGTGAVTSVKRGDVQTTFADGSQATFNLSAGGDFFGWRSVLNEHRRLRW